MNRDGGSKGMNKAKIERRDGKGRDRVDFREKRAQECWARGILYIRGEFYYLIHTNVMVSGTITTTKTKRHAVPTGNCILLNRKTHNTHSAHLHKKSIDKFQSTFCTGCI